MANHLLAIDPVLLMSSSQFKKLSKADDINNGYAADYLKSELQKQFEFADVFQSTDETHKLKVHEFMLANKTGERKMHDVGTLETPSDLLAFVSVTDKWLEEHPEIADAGAHFELDPRINPKDLHGNDGATKDGKTTGFMRYSHYKTPIMMLVPDGPVNYHDETVEDMERFADEREERLRSRRFDMKKLQTVYSSFQDANQGSAFKAFMIGWNLADRINNPEKYQQKTTIKTDDESQKVANKLNDDESQKVTNKLNDDESQMVANKLNNDESQTVANKLNNGLDELSSQRMEELQNEL